ncbi:OPT family oligopeptide transporter [Mycolicibacterium komossense]|uniref:Oligopeptide transporter, OPT family n=1 Tax=Mycolicibacterium komossense TaxID=1779 RepID=A0ABT3CAR3_9MYCO|nr:oligopeptide transporter, OPT family [Mycolicibacterium komossense]MCV7226568.1 oligopeptide transporter, OPT family [Mycolicibacterium komossense]
MTKVDSVEATTPSIRELTVRGVVLGGLITLIFTAANVYLGLKVGLTFATAIPAAVISMAILRYFRGHTILENNIVQTIASAAGTLAAIIFVLPGLIMIGWWTGFPYWITVAVCIVGGILGVMYSVPLRRALVTGSDLPYPEGVAAAEVLKVGEADIDGGEGSKRSLLAILVGSLVAAGFSLLAAMKVILSDVSAYFRVGSGGSMVGASLSLALIGVGHLVGVTVGFAMVVGLVISFFVLLPTLTWGNIAEGSAVEDIVSSTFSTDVRFVGAGAIAIAAVWTLLKIIGPIVRGIRAAAVSTRARRGGEQVELVERDLPIWIVGGTIVASLVPIALLLWWFLDSTQVTGNRPLIIVVTLLFVVFIGALLASVAGYMAGLIGSSNSPISGLGILVVIIASVVLVLVHGRTDDAAQTLGLVAYALFATAVVFGIATISNDNLQDLKTGQLVGATPWKQQVALVIGVVFGGLVIAPVLDLLNNAFGFAGAPGAGANALAAPQAALISSLAKGVFGGDLNWKLLGLGVAIGAAVILVDEVLRRATKFSLPPLAVGMGMYLPMSLTIVIPIGAVLGRSYDKWAERRGESAQDTEQKQRLGVLMATGLIVGESLFGVVFAGIVAAAGTDSPLAVVGESFASWAEILGVALFVAVVAGLYKWTRRLAVVER